ncbi:MAG: hypothetical protein HOO00_09335 [Rhodospirillaceae bacterium]|jgi:hypothetical protein|nr:hypothetical protein [Rhodospirillaceae bacterium]MBT5374332.1 hypothetical protein [Rhodospirillaceae bacterium]MBT5658789.1 hypothetical protein [Rhodospirillaceae bacterium]MBT5752583.1 hypothetical protein [Rhodospirillaceae bacterium]
MTNMKFVDLSDTPDDQLTNDQKSELQRRFQSFFAAPVKNYLDSKKKTDAPKKVSKWVPGQS